MEVAGSGAGLDRRRFLGGVGGVTAAALAGGVSGLGVLGDLTGSGTAEAAEIAPQSGVNRKASAHQYRINQANLEQARPVVVHLTNGDEELYPSKIGNFSKTLPHNALGEVDPGAYAMLQNALASGKFNDFEAIPAGGTGSLANPMGGLAFDPAGPDAVAVGVNPPPALASAQWAAQMAELYWMALLRDVAVSEFDTDPLALAARASLAQYSGYTGPRDPLSGEIRAQDLFRLDYPGVQTGPMVSQFILRPFSYDAIPIDPRISTPADRTDYVTYFPEWLSVQRGINPGGGPVPADPILRYPRTVRDLGQLAQSDRIHSQYFRAMIILSTFGNGAIDDANPYKASSRQGGFATFGLGQLAEIEGMVHRGERHTWYQKWFVHRFLRPEAGSGRVHNAKIGAAPYPIHPDLLGDDDLLDRVFEYNRQRNVERPEINQNVGSYLMPTMGRNGGPSHPSFPAGHAVTAGACIAALKAWFREEFPFPNPVQPTPDGLSLVPYTGPTLTIGGELNKLCHNLSLGRDMSGVHWRADTDDGNRQGEEVTVRNLREIRRGLPEPFTGFSLTKFNGTTITV
jgi:hypothetical protein